MATKTEAELGEEKSHTLARFWERGLRVEDHSLVADRERLLGFAQGTMTFDGGGTVISFDEAPEESVESLAARLRPFLIMDDGLHYGRVIGAIKYFTTAGSPERQDAMAVSRRWKAADPKSGKPAGYSVFGTTPGWVADTKLANMWLYGNLIHADRELETAASLQPRRFLLWSASFVICNLAVACVMTMNLMRGMELPFIYQRGDWRQFDRDTVR